MTKEAIENVIQNAPKGIETFKMAVSPEIIVNSILQQLAFVATIPDDELQEFGNSLLKIMNRVVDQTKLQMSDFVRGTT